MYKTLFTLAILASVTPASLAATKPTDQVSVLYMRISDGANELENKTYSKQWSQIKLDSKTKNKILAINAKLDKSSGGIEKYRLSWIRIVNDDVQGYMFQGTRSSTWLVEPASRYNDNKDRYMHVSLDGNGGLACRDNDPYMD
jgi:hypothetical protein